MRRRLGLAAICAGLVLLLTGCLQYNIDVSLDGNDTASGTVTVGYSAELLGLVSVAGASTDPGNGEVSDPLVQLEADLLRGGEGLTAGSIEVEPYKEGEYSGFRAIYDSVPIAEFGSSFEELATSPGSTEPSQGAGLTIVRDADRYVFEAVIDDSFSGSDENGMDVGTFLRDADLRFSVTFPGPVLESDGEISGNSVTWGTEQILSTDRIRAVGVATAPAPFGGADGGTGGPVAPIVVAIGAAAAIIVLGATAWALTAKRRSRAVGGPGQWGARR